MSGAAPPLFAWRRTFLGDGVLLAAPEGSVRIRPRVTPLLRLRELLAPVHPGPGVAGVTVDGPRGFTTAEGEYGALVNLRGEARQRTFAAVYGDDFCATFDADCTTRSAFDGMRDAVQKLAYAHALGLGADRFRNYLYAPPPGWTGLPRHASVVWISPGCPREHALLTVFKARPTNMTFSMRQHHRLFEQLPREFGEKPPSATDTFTTTQGLMAQLVTYTGVVNGRALMVSDLTLADQRYVYPARLETSASDLDGHAKALKGFAERVRPLPAPSAPVDALTSWVD